MVQIIGYGADALTLWALKDRLGVILHELDDRSDASLCKVFYRPSFGRRGGSQFGEFDFLLLAEGHLYLGETKWHRPSHRLTDRVTALHPSQKSRHRTFKHYVRRWAFGPYDDSEWQQFEREWRSAPPKGGSDSAAREGTLLADNLRTVLGVIRNYYQGAVPGMVDVLLLLHQGQPVHQLHKVTRDGFVLVAVDYSDAAFLEGERFVELQQSPLIAP
jgi:hypothetical protein